VAFSFLVDLLFYGAAASTKVDQVNRAKSILLKTFSLNTHE